MRVGIFFAEFGPDVGGAMTFPATLAAALSRSPRRSSVVAFHYGDLPAWLRHADLQFVRLERPAPVEHDRARRVIRRASRWLTRRAPSQVEAPLALAAKAQRVDVIYFPSPLLEETGLPYVYTVWDLQHRLQPYFPEVSVAGVTFEEREALYRSACRRAAINIVSNDTARDELCRFYAVDPARVRPVHQPTSDFALHTALEASDPVSDVTAPILFYPAQFWPHKNHVVVLEALKILRDAHDRRVTAVFTGSDKGNLAHVQQYARRLGISDQVRFLGFVSEAALLGLYRRAFALVFPSFFGPENQPPLEAFALRCPVIAAAVAGAQEQLGDAALTFPPHDERALAAAVLRLETESGLRDQLVARGRAIAEARSGDAYIARVFELIDELAPIRRCWSTDEPYVHL